MTGGPKNTVIANKIDANAKVAIEKSMRAKAQPTTEANTVLPSDGGVVDVSNNPGFGIAKFQPENGGAMGQWADDFATPGQMMDRFGKIDGSYASPMNTRFEMRSLPASTNRAEYFKFEVLKTFPIKSSFIAPAHYFPGGGLQYKFPASIFDLEQNGYIKFH